MTNTQITLAGITISSIGLAIAKPEVGIFWFGVCLIILAIIRAVVKHEREYTENRNRR